MTGWSALCFSLVALAFAAPAAAEPIEMERGYKPGAASLAVARDGGTFVVLQSVDRDVRPGDAPKRATLLEFLRFRRDGGLYGAATLPPVGKRAEGVPRIAVLPSGEVALFAPGGYPDGPRSIAQLLRLSADGEVRHRADVGEPAPDSGNCGNGLLYANVLESGPEGTLLVGGGRCDGPNTPWWVHLSADGRKLAEGSDSGFTPGPGVTAAAFEADGRFRLAGSHFSGMGKFDATLSFHRADGRLEARHTLLQQGGEVGWTLFTSDGVVFIGDGRRDDSAVRFYDRDGKLLRSTPWPEKNLPTSLIADGDGIAGLLGDFDGLAQIVRIDSSGRIAWRSPPANYLSLARAPDGALRTLVSRADEKGGYTVDLLTFAKP